MFGAPVKYADVGRIDVGGCRAFHLLAPQNGKISDALVSGEQMPESILGGVVFCGKGASIQCVYSA
jgi:hypothetical protein